jgi:hypothetical protein
VRVDPAKPASLGLGIGFAGRTNVRVVVVPNINANPVNWQVLLAAAAQFPNQLFIVPADEPMEPALAASTWQRARELPNVIVVAGELAPSASDNRNISVWRTFAHIGPCGNPIHHLQQNDKPLALGAVAAMARLATEALAAVAQVGPTGADLKRRTLADIDADLARKAASTDKSMKAWVTTGFARQALADVSADPSRSGWRLLTGCYVDF